MTGGLCRRADLHQKVEWIASESDGGRHGGNRIYGVLVPLDGASVAPPRRTR